jgi:serine protease inhibitor
MSRRSNLESDIQINKLSGRNNHNKNVDRLAMERNIIFNQNTKASLDMDSTGQTYVSDQSNNIGEITGNVYDQGYYGTDRGLPMRSQYTIRKQMHDPNEQLDFDLYDNRPSKLNVKSFDPSQLDSGIDKNIMGNYADISISTSKLSSEVNPTVISSSGIDRLQNNLFYFMFDYIQNNYIINGMGLYNLFASLYIISGNATEIELKKFFVFPKKDILQKGLLKINNIFLNIEDMINIKNFMIIGNDVPYDPHFYDNIKDYCILVRLDTSKTIQEANKMNLLVKRALNNSDIKNSITSENLINLQLMFLTVGIIKPIWLNAFDKIVSSSFYGNNEVKINYLYSVGKTFGYYEDQHHQLVEIVCKGNNLVMGILLHKTEIIADTDDIKLHYYISQLKNSVIDEIKIPVFKEDFKIRFNGSLKNMGLQSIFLKVTSPNMFPDGIVLQDIVQNVRIIIDNNFINTCTSNKSYRSTKNFIANKPFIYYFRLTQTNTLLFSGVYK